MSGIDLHLHSTASDGRLTPPELVRRSAGMGLTVIALTDHDTVAGISPAIQAARDFPGLKLIAGVEINTDVAQGEAHILGYFIDWNDAELGAALAKLRSSREERAQRMIGRLKGLGLPIEWERVREIARTGSVGRPHVAQALFEKGYVTSIREAFTRYIGWGGPAYVERQKMAPAEAVRLVLRASGLPVLAHPTTVPDPEAMIAELKKEGLVGMEVHYNSYSRDVVERLGKIAGKYSLVATGGSDFHGFDTTDETTIGGAGVPLESAEGLIALAKERGLIPAGP